MGNEITLVQITDLDRFRRLFAADGVDSELAAMTGSFLSPTEGRALMEEWPDPEWLPLAEFVEGMVSTAAAPQTWRLDLDRRFDRLASSMRRASTAAAKEPLVEVSVFGQKELCFATPAGLRVAKGCQGFDQRVSDAETCRSVAEFLANLSPDEVARAADLAVMVNEGVYKAHANLDAEQVKASVMNDFHALRAFYREVTATGRSVLVTRD